MTEAEKFCEENNEIEGIMDLVRLQKLTLKKDVDRYSEALES